VTTVVRADDAAAVEVACAALAGGGLVVVPTDTVYGLAARPTDVSAVGAVYRAKGRPEGMHLPVLASDVDQVRALGVAFGPVAALLAERWWPGPLTMALAFTSPSAASAAASTAASAAASTAASAPASTAASAPASTAASAPAFADGARRPEWLTGRDEVAVRIPDNAFLRSLLTRTGVLLVTSANPHGLPTPRRAEDVAAGPLGPSVEVIIDGGPLTEVPSTLVNVTGSTAVVEREGVIGADEIAAALAGVR
jgi:L-threonylcarbamoyladenylate synthase